MTRYREIMTVDTSHQTYSSDGAFGGITLKDVPLQYREESFIAMDPPRHDKQHCIPSSVIKYRDTDDNVSHGGLRGRVTSCPALQVRVPFAELLLFQTINGYIPLCAIVPCNG